MIITIDGPAGTGKSTIARLLAEKLGFIHFDTGAMYRCAAYGLIKHHINPEDVEALQGLLNQFDFKVEKAGEKNIYFFEGEDVTDLIRSHAVTALVSEISAIKDVREKLVQIQRRLGEGTDAVFEGRDMGTVVFPRADIKIFLTASPEVRAKRRYDELKRIQPAESKHVDFNTILESVNQRDHADSTRTISPLKQPDDAYVVDTSGLTIDEVLEHLLNIKNTHQ